MGFILGTPGRTPFTDLTMPELIKRFETEFGRRLKFRDKNFSIIPGCRNGVMILC